MNKEKLNMYKPNKKELVLINRQLDRLNDRLEEVPVIQGKVSGSSKDYPYIESHVTVQMAEPKASSAIKGRIREKKKRKAWLEAQISEVEEFISAMPDGIEKQVFEMVYLDDMTQEEVGEILLMERSNVSKKISDYFLKNSQHSQF